MAFVLTLSCGACSDEYDEYDEDYDESGYYDEIRARRTAFLTNANAVKAYREGIDALVRMATELTHSTVSFRLCS